MLYAGWRRSLLISLKKKALYALQDHYKTEIRSTLLFNECIRNFLRQLSDKLMTKALEVHFVRSLVTFDLRSVNKRAELWNIQMRAFATNLCYFSYSSVRIEDHWLTERSAALTLISNGGRIIQFSLLHHWIEGNSEVLIRVNWLHQFFF